MNWPDTAGLCERFRGVYGRAPEWVVRAPGRVNLIGEHTDYNLLPVLPMTIDRWITVAAASATGRTVHLLNSDARYGGDTFELSAEIPRCSDGHWGNYARAAAQELAHRIGSSEWRGADLLVESDLPPASGLSSSSALLIAAWLALAALNGVTVERHELADALRFAEQYVGTLSGGMDQAVILLGEAGHGLLIDFEPLRTRPIPVPPGAQFVVCDSLTRAEKSGKARAAYNRRVLECQAGIQLLQRRLLDGAPVEDGEEWLSARDAFAALEEWRTPPAQAILALLPPGGLQVESWRRECGEAAEQTLRRTNAGLGDDDQLMVLERLLHVWNEGQRVREFGKAMEAANLEYMGLLMDASHLSCRDFYEISTPLIERLVACCRSSGAIGARVTGAGFGGSVVALVPQSFVSEFSHRLWMSYHLPLQQEGVPPPASPETAILPVDAAGPAVVAAVG